METADLFWINANSVHIGEKISPFRKIATALSIPFELKAGYPNRKLFKFPNMRSFCGNQRHRSTMQSILSGTATIYHRFTWSTFNFFFFFVSRPVCFCFSFVCIHVLCTFDICICSDRFWACVCMGIHSHLLCLLSHDLPVWGCDWAPYFTCTQHMMVHHSKHI